MVARFAPAWHKRGVEPAEYSLMDAAEDGMWWYRALHAQAALALAPLLDAGAGPLLDAGCGTGGLLARLRARWPGARLIGLEYFAPAARRAATKSGAPLVNGSVNALPFRDGSFAGAVSLDVLCHAAVAEAAMLAELHRVLVPGGLLVLNLPAFRWLHSAHDIRVQNARRYSAADARALLTAAGFRVEATHYWNALLLPLMLVQRKILARKPSDRSDVGAFPPWLDRLFGAMTATERWLQALGLRFPAGGSLLVVARKAPMGMPERIVG